jgi:hypothetical protein
MTTPVPQKVLLLCAPRTASNLLLHVLNLSEQPHVHRLLPHDGYSFLPSLGPWFRTIGRPMKQWTPEERAALRKGFEDSVEGFCKCIMDAEKDGKGLFFKEHIIWMVEPVAKEKYIFGEDAAEGEVPWVMDVPVSVLGENNRTAADDGNAKYKSPLNATVIPDAVLEKFKAAFLIRHPALAYPSLVRTHCDIHGMEGLLKELQDGAMKSEFHMKWTRVLFDFYEQLCNADSSKKAENVRWPLVLDADDILTEPRIIEKFAELAGLDKTKVRWEWEADSMGKQENESRAAQRMRSTLNHSKGIVPGKTSIGIDIDVEAKKWTEEFGEDVSKLLEDYVRKSMVDYEVLKAKRLKV